MKHLYFAIFTFLQIGLFAQTNIKVTNTTADAVLHGDFNPQDFASTNPVTNHDAIFQGIQNGVNPDSLKSYIIRLSEFGTRNSGSDTVSNTRGIGAARRWVKSKFDGFSAANDNRLLSGYLQFDQDICDVAQHKNILGVLPGSETGENHSVIIIEGHIDSRCDTPCDTACLAQGVEDNASGTALVMELARVMSQYTFNNTLVFMLTIGEEQGLFGAEAMKRYVSAEKIPVEAVFNNDVIGGIICGKTASEPSCPGLNDIDSTQVRLFSQSVFYSLHKNLARFVKLQYQEELLPLVKVPMQITIMSAIDRTGRGGDHQPFSAFNIPAIRFTSANEHGDASNGAGYEDRQHTSDDILGVDTDNDMVVDSFFVDFNYLARNAVINGVGAAVAAIGPLSPTHTLESTSDTTLLVTIDSPQDYPSYRIGVRTLTNDFDTVYTTTETSFVVPAVEGESYYVSVASQDDNGLESLFSKPKRKVAVGIEDYVNVETQKSVYLMPNVPNPFDEATVIGVQVDQMVSYNIAKIEIRDLQGKLIQAMPLELKMGMNEVLYTHGYGYTGSYLYSLVIDGKVLETRSMVFAN